MVTGERPPRSQAWSLSTVWARFSITEHPGGIFATRRLLEQCRIQPGQRVLDVGCGTGYTACRLAGAYGAEVVGLDVNPILLAHARRRVAREGVGKQVSLLLADAQVLPFADGSFDAVIAESVLVLCDPSVVAHDACRVLRPGGVFGANELTCRQALSEHLHDLLAAAMLGIAAKWLQEGQWRSIWSEAGFVDVSATLYPLMLWEQFVSHLRIDGVRRYAAAFILLFTDPAIRAAYLNWAMLRGAFELMPYLGYGLFVGRKPAR